MGNQLTVDQRAPIIGSKVVATINTDSLMNAAAAVNHVYIITLVGGPWRSFSPIFNATVLSKIEQK